MKDDEILFAVTVRWIQNEAMDYINRKLTEDEILVMKKCIESGLEFGIETVFHAAIDEAVKICSK